MRESYVRPVSKYYVKRCDLVVLRFHSLVFGEGTVVCCVLKCLKVLDNCFGVCGVALLVWSVVGGENEKEQSVWITCFGSLGESKIGLGS